MVRTRRSRRNKLRPPLPEERDLITTPRYFGIIHGAGSGKKKKLEVPLPLIMPKAKKVPRPIPSVKRGRNRDARIQAPMPKPGKVPLIIKAGRAFRSRLTGSKLIWPDRMPTYPTLNNQRLYTRYPAMKTVTKVTDANGKIVVDFYRAFDEIPGVVMTVKSSDAITGNVSDVTKTTFEAIFHESVHSHGGATNDGGKHTPTINADGGHMHDILGELYYTLYKTLGGLTADEWSDYESAAGDPHRHRIGWPAQWNYYMTNMVIDDLTLWTTYEESPLHYHSAQEVPFHDHPVAEDGGALLKNTSVTITYLAQVESEI